MTENNTKLTKPQLIIGSVVLIILFFVFSNKPSTEQVENLQKPIEEVFKNSSEESTTTPAVDANSTFLKEELARKRQRDADREKCIADIGWNGMDQCKASASTCHALQANAKEETDRCYFRFPNN